MFALLTTLTPVGCGLFTSDYLALDPDVISIAIVLVAGEDRAQLAVAYPHRPASDSPPRVSASLIGRGWRAAFTHTTDPRDGCGGRRTNWPFQVPMVCLNAALPEPIREGATYKLEGEGPHAAFTGETVIPAAPRLLGPGDTLWIQSNPDSSGWFQVPIRYRAPPEVGTLWPEMFATLSDSTGTESKWIAVRPLVMDVEGHADTVSISRRADESKIERSSLHLLGIGWQYTNFMRSRTRFPQASFGISGEGVYGYFGGGAKSRPIQAIVEERR